MLPLAHPGGLGLQVPRGRPFSGCPDSALGSETGGPKKKFILVPLWRNTREMGKEMGAGGFSLAQGPGSGGASGGPQGAGRALPGGDRSRCGAQSKAGGAPSPRQGAEVTGAAGEPLAAAPPSQPWLWQG